MFFISKSNSVLSSHHRRKGRMKSSIVRFILQQQFVLLLLVVVQWNLTEVLAVRELKGWKRKTQQRSRQQQQLLPQNEGRDLGAIVNIITKIFDQKGKETEEDSIMIVATAVPSDIPSIQPSNVPTITFSPTTTFRPTSTVYETTSYVDTAKNATVYESSCDSNVISPNTTITSIQPVLLSFQYKVTFDSSGNISSSNSTDSGTSDNNTAVEELERFLNIQLSRQLMEDCTFETIFAQPRTKSFEIMALHSYPVDTWSTSTTTDTCHSATTASISTSNTTINETETTFCRVMNGYITADIFYISRSKRRRIQEQENQNLSNSSTPTNTSSREEEEDVNNNDNNNVDVIRDPAIAVAFGKALQSIFQNQIDLLDQTTSTITGLEFLGFTNNGAYDSFGSTGSGNGNGNTGTTRNPDVSAVVGPTMYQYQSSVRRSIGFGTFLVTVTAIALLVVSVMSVRRHRRNNSSSSTEQVQEVQQEQQQQKSNRRSVKDPKDRSGGGNQKQNQMKELSYAQELQAEMQQQQQQQQQQKHLKECNGNNENDIPFKQTNKNNRSRSSNSNNNNQQNQSRNITVENPKKNKYNDDEETTSNPKVYVLGEEYSSSRRRTGSYTYSYDEDDDENDNESGFELYQPSLADDHSRNTNRTDVNQQTIFVSAESETNIDEILQRQQQQSKKGRRQKEKQHSTNTNVRSTIRNILAL